LNQSVDSGQSTSLTPSSNFMTSPNEDESAIYTSGAIGAPTADQDGLAIHKDATSHRHRHNGSSQQSDVVQPPISSVRTPEESTLISMLMRVTDISLDEAGALIDSQSDKTLALIYQYLSNPDVNLVTTLDAKTSSHGSPPGPKETYASLVQPNGANESDVDTIPLTALDAIDAIAKSFSEAVVGKKYEGREAELRKEICRLELGLKIKEERSRMLDDYEQHKNDQPQSNEQERVCLGVIKEKEAEEDGFQSDARDNGDDQEGSREAEHESEENEIKNSGDDGEVDESDVEQISSNLEENVVMKMGIKEFSEVVEKAIEHEKALMEIKAQAKSAANSQIEPGDVGSQETSKKDSTQDSSDDDNNNNNNTDVIEQGEQSVTGTHPTSVNGTSSTETAHSPFGVLDIVAHRLKDVLAKRYTWLESPCPKLFIILPADYEIGAGHSQTWLDFDLHFLCDCGDLPAECEGFSNPCKTRLMERGVCSCAPHVDWDVRGFPQHKDLLKFGTYMMAILEMLEYGLTVDGIVRVPPLKDRHQRKRVMYSMVFLMKQGIETSHQLLAKGYSSLDEIKPVAPLKEAEFMDLYRSRIAERRPFRNSFAYRTVEGDIRWLCQEHYTMHTPSHILSDVSGFTKEPGSQSCTLDQNMSTLTATLTNSSRGSEFYKMAAKFSTVPVISYFLDWDLSKDEENTLEEAVQSFTASCVKIYVRDREEEHPESVPGFGHRFFAVTMAALRNKNIQSFTIERGISGDTNNEHVDELFASKGAVYLDPVLARFTRELVSPKIQLGLLVTDLDLATRSLRVGMNGFDMLSKLTMEASYWDHIDIDFGVYQPSDDNDNTARMLQDGELGKENENDNENENENENKNENKNENESEGEVDLFNRRNCDAISVRTYLSADTMFLKTYALKDVNIRIAFPEDGPRIRELIKSNRRLAKMELSIESKDDPCQVFEYFKAIMNNHPSLDSFHLRKDWGKNNKSTFAWHGVSDRSKMTLSIMSYAEDKIGALLQKFGACLLQLFIHSINIQDSVILEKVTRSRKGQLKLVTISLVDVFGISLTALDELTKVVLRVPLQRFQITGTVNPRTTSRVGEFMTTVATKITDIHFYGEHAKAILVELTKRMPESSNMELLDELKLSGPFDATTKDLAWIRSILDKTIPLSTIELHKVNLSHQGWMTLAQEIDFKRLKYFRVGPDVPLKIEAVKAFVHAVPAKSELENFHLDSGGLKEMHCRAYKAKVLTQLRKRTALVSIGRYF